MEGDPEGLRVFAAGPLPLSTAVETAADAWTASIDLPATDAAREEAALEFGERPRGAGAAPGISVGSPADTRDGRRDRLDAGRSPDLSGDADTAGAPGRRLVPVAALTDVGLPRVEVVTAGPDKGDEV